jgi:hypothetical protein
MQNWNEAEWYVEEEFYFNRSYVLKILWYALLRIFPLCLSLHKRNNSIV